MWFERMWPARLGWAQLWRKGIKGRCRRDSGSYREEEDFGNDACQERRILQNDHDLRRQKTYSLDIARPEHQGPRSSRAACS
jgi:hypothetical protein